MKALESLEVPFIGKTVNADAFYKQTASAPDKAVNTERTLAHFFAGDEYEQGVLEVIANTSVYLPVTFKEVIVTATKGHDVIVAGQTKNFYSIPYQAFKGATVLKSVVLQGAKLNEIGEEAFSGCTGLKSVVIPDTVKTIYKNAFNGCIKLATVTVSGTDVELKDSVFAGCVAMNKLNSTDDKTIDLTNFKTLGVDSLDFGRKVTYTIVGAQGLDVETAFGETYPKQ
jgi:hypothetical protein